MGNKNADAENDQNTHYSGKHIHLRRPELTLEGGQDAQSKRNPEQAKCFGSVMNLGHTKLGAWGDRAERQKDWNVFAGQPLVWIPRTAVAMELTDLEREFLQRLMEEPWHSPPLFEHSLIARLVEAGYVQTDVLPTTGTARYAITEAGRAAVS